MNLIIETFYEVISMYEKMLKHSFVQKRYSKLALMLMKRDKKSESAILVY
jgi:hypothetical protein